MNNKGFTMIELLAVVTILSIILLVSFPALINMTRSDKEREYKDLANTLCKAGETYIYNNKELYPELGTSGEEFYIRVASLIDEELVNKSQTNPKNGKSIDQNLLKYKVKGDKTLSCSYLERSLATLVNDTGESGLSVGDKYSYEVRSGTKYNFYVLSFNSDDTVNLIMDRNICEDGTTNYTEENNYCRVAWEPTNNNSNGPITAMTYLGNATRTWKNVSNITIDYNDEEENEALEIEWTYGYIGVTIKDGVGYIINKDGTKTPIELEDNMPIKARLAKATELKTEYTNCTINSGSCDAWLVENLKYWSGANNKYSINSEYIEGTPIYNIKGYWIMSSDANFSYAAYLVSDHGSITSNNTYLAECGVRPIITVPKSDFED